MMHPLLAGFVFAITAEAASAGAWTLDRGDWQVFSGIIASRATGRFDSAGRASEKTDFDKLTVENTTEYGLTDAVTIYADPQWVIADMDGAKFRSTSVEAGARILLFTRIGMLSLQSSAKTAGAFDMSTAAGGQAGRQFELRLLYGDSFQFLGHEGFLDLQAAERWIKRPRPNEVDFDATLGLRLTANNLVLVQSFSLIGGGGARPPYSSYRLHKLQASWVREIAGHWSLQAGYFHAVAGRNIVKENGIIAELWYRH